MRPTPQWSWPHRRWLNPAATTPAISAPPDSEPPPEANVAPPASRAWPRWLVAATVLLPTIALSTLASNYGVSALRASQSAGWSDPTGLTYDDGLQTNPSFSRDGMSIVFAAGDATHNFRIYTQRVDEDGENGWSSRGGHEERRQRLAARLVAEGRPDRIGDLKATQVGSSLCPRPAAWQGR